MTLLSVVQDVCLTVGVTSPGSVFSGISANRTMQEMLSLANEMARRIASDQREWNKLKKINVFTGDGVTTTFSYPVNFKRMLLNGNVWRSTSALHPMVFTPDLDEWIQRRAMNWFNAWGEWTNIGGQMVIAPTPGAGVTVTFPYLDKNCITLASGGVGDSFASDSDSFLLGDRILKLGMIWQWKAQKGSPYAEDLSTYNDHLTYLLGNDTPSPILIGRGPISQAWITTNIAYPYPVPTGAP
jgi:hypothetical protein